MFNGCNVSIYCENHTFADDDGEWYIEPDEVVYALTRTLQWALPVAPIAMATELAAAVQRVAQQENE
jgi:hypothetical protein